MLSTATSVGPFNRAEVAGPPSPEYPSDGDPLTRLPATVVIVLAVTFRISWLVVSAMKLFPALSTATPSGKKSLAAVAGPPSPE